MAASIFEDEMLCEEVRKYPALYNKMLKEYKDRLVQEICFNKVAEGLSFKNILPF